MSELARFWKPMENKEVRCFLCYRLCRIREGEKGYCHVRKNVDGKLYSLNYGKAIAINVDPIEKKPFYHFMPGTQSFSFSTVGCNFRCEFCFAPDSAVLNDDSVKTLEELFGECENKEEWKNGEVAFVGDRKTITACGKKKGIAKVFRHFYEGDMLTINPRHAPAVTCTPYHEFYVWRDGKTEKLAAGQLKKDDLLVIPKIKAKEERIVIDAKEVLERNISKIKKGRKLDEKGLERLLKLKKSGKTSREMGWVLGMHPVYLRKLLGELKRNGISRKTFEYDNIVREENGHVKFKTERGTGIPKKIRVNNEFAELLGYYCAEGHASKSPDRPNSFKITFSYGKHEKKLIGRTCRLVEKIFGTKPKIVHRRTTATVEAGGSSLGVLFKELCGKNSKNKKVPSIISKSNKTIINAFLKAYIAGDGTILKDNIAINTVSKRLAMGIYHLFLLLGYLPSFYTWVPPKKKRIEGRLVNQSTLYYVKLRAERFREDFLGNKNYKRSAKSEDNVRFRETKKFWLVPVRINKQQYSGYVYNMEVEDEHSYITNFMGVGNCQNYEISQAFGGVTGEDLPPEKIQRICNEQNIPGVAYTYTEPTIFMEYALDTAKLTMKDGRYNVFVTNGYMTTAAINEMNKYIDASRIDLKGFHDEVYKKLCGDVVLEYVLSSIKELHKRQHIELINLIIPGHNDDEDDIRASAKWVKKLSPDIPMHYIGFYPANRMMDTSSTSLTMLKRAREIAIEEGLNYVYTGNRQDEDTESTYCPECKEKVIKRFGFGVVENKLDKDSKCPDCGYKLNVITDLEKYRKWKKERMD